MGLLNKITLTSLGCLSVCIELHPSHATKASPISRATASVEARCLHLHPPLLASKAVFSLWSLVVLCALNAGVTGVTSWYQAVVRGTRHYIREHNSIYVRVYMVCTGTRGSPVAHVGMYECVRIFCDVRMAYLGEYTGIHLFGDDF